MGKQPHKLDSSGMPERVHIPERRSFIIQFRSTPSDSAWHPRTFLKYSFASDTPFSRLWTNSTNVSWIQFHQCFFESSSRLTWIKSGAFYNISLSWIVNMVHSKKSLSVNSVPIVKILIIIFIEPKSLTSSLLVIQQRVMWIQNQNCEIDAFTSYWKYK